jgi:hypothetical protein
VRLEQDRRLIIIGKLAPRPCSSPIFPASITPWPHRGIACITSPASLLAAFKVSLEVFEVSLEVMGGDFLDPPASGDRLAPVRATIENAIVVCSAVPEIAVNRDLSTVGSPVKLLTAKGNTIEARVTELRALGEFATWRAARAVGDHDLNSFFVRADALEANEKLQPGNDGMVAVRRNLHPMTAQAVPRGMRSRLLPQRYW